MKTFSKYLEEKDLHIKLVEMAQIMSEKNVSPDTFLKNWYEENEPELANILNEAGLWDNIKDFGKGVWQGVKQNAQQFAANQWGPAVQFDNAIKTLNTFIDYLKNNPQLAGMHGSRGSLVNQVNGLTGDLMKLKPYLPQYAAQTTGQWGQPNKPVMNNAVNNSNNGNIPMPPPAPSWASNAPPPVQQGA